MNEQVLLSQSPVPKLSGQAASPKPKRKRSRTKSSKITAWDWLPSFLMGFSVACLFFIVSVFLVLKFNPPSGISSASRSDEIPAVNGDLTLENGDRDEAVNFLVSRLDPIFSVSKTQNSLLWQAYNFSLGEQWSWCEKSVNKNLRNATGSLHLTCYSLNPSELDIRVEITPQLLNRERVWQIMLECQFTDCISIYPSIELQEADRATTEHLNNTQSHGWLYASRTDAERSATALYTLLLAAGSKKAPF